MGAMEGDQILVLGADQVLQAATAMQGERFQLLDPESSLAIFNGIGVDQSLGLQSGQLAGMFNAMETQQFQEVGGDQLVQVVGNITKDDLAGFNSDQALGIATNLDLAQIGGLGAPQLFGLTTAIDADEVSNLGSDVLQVVVNQVTVEDLQTLNPVLAGEIFGVVPDNTITGLDPERAQAALVASGADFFQGGAGGLQNTAGGETVFDTQDVGTSDALSFLALGEGANFFGAANLPGGAP